MNEITRRALSAPPSDAAEAQRGKGTSARVGTIVLPNGSYGEDGLPDVRIPKEVVERGIGFLKERVKEDIEIVDDDDTREGEGDEDEE